MTPSGRYHVVCADGMTFSSYTDDLETAGEWYLDGRGNLEIYDEVAKRYIDPEAEIDCVAEAWDNWWWSQRVWWARVLHKLGLNDPRPVNWTINKKLGLEPRWWYVLRLLGIVGN